MSLHCAVIVMSNNVRLAMQCRRKMQGVVVASIVDVPGKGLQHNAKYIEGQDLVDMGTYTSKRGYYQLLKCVAKVRLTAIVT